ncbi:MAG: hypothetical protein RL291_688 [Pseudomonadota bacterium]|jgi:hypothetical protein
MALDNETTPSAATRDACGNDASKWAKAFIDAACARGDLDVAFAAAWFAEAMAQASDARQRLPFGLPSSAFEDRN